MACAKTKQGNIYIFFFDISLRNILTRNRVFVEQSQLCVYFSEQFQLLQVKIQSLSIHHSLLIFTSFLTFIPHTSFSNLLF